MSIFGYFLAAQEAEEGDDELRKEIVQLKSQIWGLSNGQKKLNKKLNTLMTTVAKLLNSKVTK